MHTYQHGRAQQHDRCGLAPLVNETTKDRSQNQRSQCRKSGKCTGHILIDTVFDNHQLGSKLLEWEYTRVEQYTQQCYQPETGIDQNILHILKRELLFLIFRTGSNGSSFHLFVQLLVHHCKNEESNHTAQQQNQTQQHRCGNTESTGQRNGYGITGLRTDTC